MPLDGKQYDGCTTGDNECTYPSELMLCEFVLANMVNAYE